MILATSAIGVAALAIGGALAFGVTTPQDEPPAPAAERVSTAPAAFTASMMPGPVQTTRPGVTRASSP